MSTGQPGRGGKPPRRMRRAVVALLILLVLALAADYWLYPRWGAIGGQSGNAGDNGLWLRYRWYFGERTDEETAALAQQLEQREIRYAYFHVRYISREGKLRFREPDAARRLVEIVHREAPSVEAIAWIYAGNQRGRGEVDLSKPDVREAMVGEAVWLVEECTFDGIQWDYEVCLNGDPHFLSLMRETREALPEGRLLSAATPVWAPWPLVRRWGWSEAYFAQVAQTCDQVAVMCYDTGLYLPRAYVWLVRQQVTHVTRAVAGESPDCRVVLGLPTYGKDGVAHHAQAENIRLALKGVREGLGSPNADLSVFAGIAPFADYTTEPDEWTTYRELWLEGGRQPFMPRGGTRKR